MREEKQTYMCFKTKRFCSFCLCNPAVETASIGSGLDVVLNRSIFYKGWNWRQCFGRLLAFCISEKLTQACISQQIGLADDKQLKPVLLQDKSILNVFILNNRSYGTLIASGVITTLFKYTNYETLITENRLAVHFAWLLWFFPINIKLGYSNRRLGLWDLI